MIDNRCGVRVAWSGAKFGNTGNTGSTGSTGNAFGSSLDSRRRGGRNGNGRAVLSRAALQRRTGRGGGAECESIAKSTASAGNAQIELIFQWTAYR